MRFLNFQHGDSIEKIQLGWDEYNKYLASIREALPQKTRDFILTDWYYNSHDPRCPHDAWVECAILREEAKGERNEIRKINFELRLLGAWHNGYVDFTYYGVKDYLFSRPGNVWLPPDNAGHGDWLHDEIRISENSFVLHEIVFRHGAKWVIECSEIEHAWIPFENNGL